MKTSQIMMREFAGEYIRQDHLTKMFNATDLSKLFPSKNLYDWVNKKDTELYIKTIMDRECIPFDQVIRSFNVRRGETSGTWVHPLLAIDLAMWLSVDFKYDVIRWVFDNLCKTRDEAGNNHNYMCETIREVLMPTNGWVYAEETMMVQDLANIETGHRNLSNENKLKLLADLQKWNAKLIRKGIHNKVTRRARLIEFLEINSL